LRGGVVEARDPAGIACTADNLCGVLTMPEVVVELVRGKVVVENVDPGVAGALDGPKDPARDQVLLSHLLGATKETPILEIGASGQLSAILHEPMMDDRSAETILVSQTHIFGNRAWVTATVA